MTDAEIKAKTKCSWCERLGASIRALMSREHPVCGICFMVWYDNDPATPDELVRMSLGEEGKVFEKGLELRPGGEPESPDEGQDDEGSARALPR